MKFLTSSHHKCIIIWISPWFLQKGLTVVTSQNCWRLEWAVGRYGVLTAKFISISFIFPFSQSIRLICTDQTGKKKKEKNKKRRKKIAVKIPTQTFCSSREDCVKVADGLLWHKHSVDRNENRSRLAPRQLRLFCSEITWRIISVCCCKQKKSPLKK